MTEEKEKKKRSCGDIIRFYLTGFFILLASFSSFAFLFLVPFVIDPSISTLQAEFDSTPKVCVTVDSISLLGNINCTWSSCKEGCTTELFKCTQISVNYKSDPDGYFEGKNYTDLEEMGDMTWDYTYAKLYPNVRGCGYPPEVNCSIFNRQYSKNGTVYPCYYSKIDPEVVITFLDLDEVYRHLFYAIAIPWGCFTSALLYIICTYAICSRSSKPPSSDDELQETSSAKASKEASNYSLRSFSKTINQGVNRLRMDPDDKGEDEFRGSSDILLAPANLAATVIRRDVLPPLERTPPVPRPSSSACALESEKLLRNDDSCKKSWP